MTEPDWRSPNGVANATALRVHYGAGLAAIAEYDRIGHLLLYHATQQPPVSTREGVVGIAMLRRAVTLFTGIRTLLEHSLPDVAKAPARAYMELWLQHQCLAYGSAQPISLYTPTTSAAREPRARRYHVAGERRGLLMRAVPLFGEDGTRIQNDEQSDSLHRELIDEIGRLRRDYPEEWTYFGDMTEYAIVEAMKREKAWFTPEFGSPSVTSVAQLAAAFGHAREYYLLYDAFSALMHSRGTGHDLTIEGATADVHHPHDPTWFQTIAWFGAGWHQMLLMTAAKWHYVEMIPQLQTLFKRHKEGIASLQPATFPNLLA